MAAVIDYLRDETGDLVIRNGDFVKGDATKKHIATLIEADPGTFSQSPTTGVGINDLIADELSPSEIKSMIIEQLEADGISINKLKVSDDFTIQIEGKYK